MNELFPSQAMASRAPDVFAATSPSRLSPKQRTILEFLGQSPSITLKAATALVGGNIYANASKHTGNLLSNMVRRGLIVRVAPGKFSRP